jgi:hypothetical protein
VTVEHVIERLQADFKATMRQVYPHGDERLTRTVLRDMVRVSRRLDRRQGLRGRPRSRRRRARGIDPHARLDPRRFLELVVSMDALKEAFRACMSELFPMGKPSALRWPDLVHIFVAGWTEALEAHGFDGDLAALKSELVRLARDDWKPDASWKWK